jgi:CubicO group peptidase (beta-lactamase class C family)
MVQLAPALLSVCLISACTTVSRTQAPSGPQSSSNSATRDAFSRITPAEAGYSSAGLDSLRTALAESGSESMLLLHDGKVFFEWGDIRQKRLVHSIRKPLLHALIGMEAHRPCLALDSTLASLGIDDEPLPLTEAERHATVRQVLQSRSGVYLPAAAESDGMSAARPARGSHAPGSFFYYNNWDFNVAGALYERCTGQRIHEAFRTKLAEPLGMLDYQHVIAEMDGGDLPDPLTVDGIRSYERQHSRYPAYHFRLSAHDLALFGQLYLDHGRWRGRQLVPSAWIDLGTQPVSVINAQYGLAYGMLWDVLIPDPGEQRPSFYHTGVGVHMLGVYPARRLVMVHRVNTEQEFRFTDAALNRIIRLMRRARLPDS